MSKWHRVAMCVGPIGISVADVAATLYGQPANYWSDGYQCIREDNLLAHLLLATHPAAFVAANLLWICSYCPAILFLPSRTAKILAFSIMLAQGIAASTWIVQYPYGPFWVAVLILLIRILGEKLIWSDRRPAWLSAGQLRGQSESFR